MSTYVEISFSIPDSIAKDLQYSEVYANYTQAGNVSSYAVDLKFPPLHLNKSIKSSDFDLLPAKIEQTVHAWEKKFLTHLEKEKREVNQHSVDDLNRRLEKEKQGLDSLLQHTLDIDDAVDWAQLYRKDPFKIAPAGLIPLDKIRTAVSFAQNGMPKSYAASDKLAPLEFDTHRASYSLLTRLFSAKRIKLEFEALEEKQLKKNRKIDKDNAKLKLVFLEAQAKYEEQQQIFEDRKKADNEAVDTFKSRYLSGDREAVEDYCDLVQSNSIYPEGIIRNWEIEFNGDNNLLIIQMDLPAPGDLPDIASYNYVKSKNQTTEKAKTKAAAKAQFESVAYQICVRTIHELFESDQIEAIDSVAFNGLVTSVNPGTGMSETKVIVSCTVTKAEFLSFDLSKVDPKACFKQMKGVAASVLIDLSPIPPVIQISKTDKRFIGGKDITQSMDASTNLASMDWQDFEHLIREIFEKEFAHDGGEVHVTQGSSDGGVDAIAFDPDPIRGGKIVIQAKRYTNTVGVAAVRDLYGTVMNEGATKGILVTTTDYGSDSYNFAKDKPLTLMNGNNLLSLLEKHGHQARINVAEAKKML